MTFAILIEDYNLFYTNTFSGSEVLSTQNYSERLNLLLQKKYYQADSLALALEKLGNKTEIIIPDCNPLQKQWANENNKVLYAKWNLQAPIRSYRTRVLKENNTFDSIRQEILKEQLKQLKPDVVFVYSGIWIEKLLLKNLKKQSVKLVLQWSCTIEGRWNNLAFNEFDLITTSSQNILQHFQSKKIPALLIQQAFDEQILEKIKTSNKTKKNAVFIGSFSSLHHQNRIELLDYLSQKSEIDIFCPDLPNEESFKNIASKRKGSVDGIEMFDTYTQYNIAIHFPGNEFMNDAGAKRLFEVTGIGVLLLCAHQNNLSTYFKPGEEIVTFISKEDCLEKINYYIANPEIRKKIALAGQKRTLKDHSFSNRAKQLCQYLDTDFEINSSNANI